MKVLFCDLETTGLDLEFAWILYDIKEETELDSFRCVLFGSEAKFLPMPKVVQEMHTKSGLFADCDEAGENETVWEASAAELATLEALHSFDIGRGDLIMAGFTPHFDRNFLAREMTYLHYRHLDVSTLRTLEKAWLGENQPKVDRHRAMPDCEEAIAELLRFKRMWPGHAGNTPARSVGFFVKGTARIARAFSTIRGTRSNSSRASVTTWLVQPAPVVEIVGSSPKETP